MKILIDTHIFLWMAVLPQKLSKKQLEILENLENQLFLSSMSIAEISIKESIGKLKIEFNIKEAINKMEINVLNFDIDSALILKTLPFHHKDPFDRMIIAQSISKNIPIMTNDEKFKLYNVKLI